MSHDFLVCFSKTGPVKFTSHLDLLKIFQRAFRRCGLPVSYSEGFSPHQKISFALPLPVGMEGMREYAQTEFTERPPADEALGLLGSALPDGIRPICGRYMEENERPAASIVSAALYEFTYPIAIPEENIEFFMKRNEITVMKKTKRNLTETDIRPHIHKCETLGNNVRVLLAAGGRANVKPDLAAEALALCLPGRNAPQSVRRLEIYRDAGGVCLPLSEGNVKI